jgi:hypothetical protein
MTHGRAAFTEFDDHGDRVEGLKDVQVPGGFLGLDLVKTAAYGWSKAKRLAAKGGQLGEPTGADNNADTLALFGSSELIFIRESFPLNR